MSKKYYEALVQFKMKYELSSAMASSVPTTQGDTSGEGKQPTSRGGPDRGVRTEIRAGKPAVAAVEEAPWEVAAAAATSAPHEDPKGLFGGMAGHLEVFGGMPWGVVPWREHALAEHALGGGDWGIEPGTPEPGTSIKPPPATQTPRRNVPATDGGTSSADSRPALSPGARGRGAERGGGNVAATVTEEAPREAAASAAASASHEELPRGLFGGITSLFGKS